MLGTIVNVNNAKWLGIAGSLIVFIGMFLPLYTTETNRAAANFFGFPVVQYMLLIVLLAASIALCFTKYLKHIAWIGLVILGYVLLALYGLHRMMEAYRFRVVQEIPDDVRLENAERLTVGLGIGWVPLLLGAVMIIAAGILIRRRIKLLAITAR